MVESKFEVEVIQPVPEEDGLPPPDILGITVEEVESPREDAFNISATRARMPSMTISFSSSWALLVINLSFLFERADTFCNRSRFTPSIADSRFLERRIDFSRWISKKRRERREGYVRR